MKLREECLNFSRKKHIKKYLKYTEYIKIEINERNIKMNGEQIAIYVIGALIFIVFEIFMELSLEAREQNLKVSRKRRIKKHLKEKEMNI